MIPIPKGLFLTPGRQSQPFRQARSSLGQYQMPARASAGRTEDAATEALMMTASYAAGEFNAQAGFERDQLRESAEAQYLETLAYQRGNFPDNPENWRKEAKAAADQVINSGTTKANPFLDILFNDERANKKLHAFTTKLDARHAYIEHDGISKKQVRQIGLATIKLSESMNRQITLSASNIENGVQSREAYEAGGYYSLLQQESGKKVSELIDTIQNMSHINAEARAKLTDIAIETWGTNLVAAMQKFHPTELGQNLARMNHLFSDDFMEGKYTDYFDQDYQNERYKSLSTLLEARTKLNYQATAGRGQAVANKLDTLISSIHEELQKGNPSGDWRAAKFKEAQLLITELEKVRIPGTVKDEVTGKVHDRALYTKDDVRKIEAQIYDPLFFPVKQKLLRDLKNLSRDNHHGNANKLYDHMMNPDNTKGKWNIWRQFISRKERESFILAANRLISAEDAKKAADLRGGRTRSLNALARSETTKLQKSITDALLEGAPEDVSGAAGLVEHYAPLDVERLEELLRRGEEKIRIRLGNADEDPLVINDVIDRNREEIANASPTFKSIAREFGLTLGADSAINQDFDIAMLPWMTSTGGHQKMLTAMNTQRDDAERDIGETRSVMFRMFDAAHKHSKIIDLENLNDLSRSTMAKYSHIHGLDRQQAEVGWNFIADSAMLSNNIIAFAEVDRNNFESGRRTLPETNVLQHRIESLEAAGARIDALIENKMFMGRALRNIIFGSGEGGISILDSIKSRINKSLDIQRKFLSIQNPDVNFGTSAITKDDMISHLDLNNPPTDKFKSIALGDFGGSLETFGPNMTKLQILLGSIGDGDNKTAMSAMKFLRITPELASDFMPIWQNAISHKSLQTEGGYKSILAYTEAAHTLSLHKYYLGDNDKPEFSLYVNAWKSAQLSGEVGFKKAQRIIEYIDRNRAYNNQPIDKASIWAHYTDADKRQGLINKTVALFTGEDNLSSGFKSWGTFDDLDAHTSLISAIQDIMRTGHWSVSDSNKRPDEGTREDWIAQFIYDSLTGRSFASVDLLSVQADDDVVKFVNNKGEFGFWLTPGMRRGVVTTGGIKQHLSGTDLGQFIAANTAGITQGGMYEAEAHTELLLMTAMAKRFQQAALGGEDVRKAMRVFRYKDVAYAFRSDVGMSRDLLFRAIDEAVWDHYGVPHDKRPKDINYNIGHKDSVFGLHKSFATSGPGEMPALDPYSRDKFNILAGNGLGKGQSNFQVITNMVDGTIVPSRVNGRSTFTIVLTDPAKWEPLTETLGDVAYELGIPQTARDVPTLSEARTNVVYQVQIPVKDDNSLEWRLIQQWKKGVLQKNQRTPDSQVLWARLSVPSFFKGYGKNVEEHRVTVPELSQTYKVHGQYAHGGGKKWDLRTGDEVPPTPPSDDKVEPVSSSLMQSAADKNPEITKPWERSRLGLPPLNVQDAADRKIEQAKRDQAKRDAEQNSPP